ncbi:sigma 54-interacting transcriptional regulator [Wukongibacter sp. M2B1]|uniref:sigma 54-interacting transcriptional regulator n=1 Tax=Wukongibacter sp. M2B1 TaxID=3088895 RepID=UPI003D79C5FF
MYYQKEIVIDNPKGLHTRAAAIVSFNATRINRKYGVKLFIQKNESKIPITSMLALTTLGIRKGDRVLIGYDEDKNCKQALDEMAQCLIGKIDVETPDIEAIDRVLDKNTLTSESLIESISNGVVVVNEDNRVILFNRAAEKITNIKRNEIIGKKANEILEGSKLHEVLKTGKESVQEKQKLGNITIITNRSPIIVDNNIIGAVAVFQDISEIERLSNKLESVIEIKEQFGNIVNYANDGICMVDEKGIITYVNPEFERIWNLDRAEIQGKYVEDTLPSSAIAKVIKTGEKKLGVLIKKEEGVKIISNAAPIFINNVFKGVVSISKEETQLQKMIEKLSEAEEKIKYFKDELDRKQNIHEAFDIIIGKSGALKDVLYISSKAAKTSSTVLIHGESGTGKELLARAIASASSRKNKPFVRLNCAAIPENLLESELFGHVKGAFTSAIKDKLGKFQLADGGTIFLDEIGDVSKEMQVKLLRVLQEREFERVGGNQTIKVDVRVIAATNRNLEEMIKMGEFREDLYYRLNVIPITLPPLVDRKGDIPLLVEHFIEKICTREGMAIKKASVDIFEYLEKYNWPGNIRELENIIERAIALSDEEILNRDCLPIYINGIGKSENKELINLVDGDLVSLEAYEKNILKLALEKHKSFNKVGKVLGITHRTVALKARKYGLR